MILRPRPGLGWSGRRRRPLPRRRRGLASPRRTTPPHPQRRARLGPRQAGKNREMPVSGPTRDDPTKADGKWRSAGGARPGRPTTGIL